MNPSTNKAVANGIASRYRQRGYKLRSRWVDAADLLQSENRLIDLAATADTPDSARDTGDEADVFADLAVGLTAGGRVAARTAETAYQALASEDTQTTATAALICAGVLPDRATRRYLMQHFAGARPRLIQVWQAQGLDFAQEPASIVADFSDDEAGVAAWLSALADCPGVSRRDFLAHCNDRVGDAPRESLPLAWVAPILWGGLVRGTGGLAPLITRLLTDRAGNEGCEHLARLAALNGDAIHFAAIQAHAESDPETGLETLALMGDATAAAYLLDRLGDVRTQEPAARAWHWLTGQPLARRPRLMAMANQAPVDAPLSEQDTIPDADAAHAWWSAHGAQWPAGQRYALGEPLTAPHLAQLARRWTGPAGRDLADLLALQHGRPLGIASRAWEPTRQQLLQRLQA